MILDASVIVSWFLPDEADGDSAAIRAAALASPDAAIVPRICWTEVANALARAVRRGRLRPEGAMAASTALEELMMLIPATDVDPAAALRLALDLDAGVFDAAYLVLARTTDRSLRTRDRRLAELAAEAGVVALHG